MIQLVVFVNLFFIPVLPLYMIYRKKREALNWDLLFQYCIIVACNIPLTKVIIFSVKKLLGVSISIDSGYYTVTALVSALLIYMLYRYQDSKATQKLWSNRYAHYKTYLKKKSWSEKIRQRGGKRIRKELAPAYVLIFTSCFMTLVFEPILMYASNKDDFWFDFSIMIWPVLGGFACFLLCGIVLVSLLYFVNLFFSDEMILYKGLTLLGYLGFFLLYLQGNWLSGNLPPLTGEPIAWENYGKTENAVLKIAFVLLIIVALIWIRRVKLDRTIYRAFEGAGFISLLLIVSLIPTITENEALKSKDTFSPTLENFNTVSKKQNFLIFLVDAVDSRVFYDVMTHDEDFNGMLDDFTYYPDSLSAYALTQNSIPTILTGIANRNETNYLDYSSNAYNQSPLFEKLEQNGYGINLYSGSVAWGGHRNFEIENSTSIYDIKVNFKEFIKQELKYVRFKYLPYGFKQRSEIETLDFNSCRKENSAQVGYNWANRKVYGYLQEPLEKRDQKYFQFIHCEGGHTPHNMDKYFNAIDGGTYPQKVGASLTMIKTYLRRLKENDAYDNSIIVIMADHGYETIPDEAPYEGLQRLNPILFIKGINEKHQMMKSDRTVSYLDLQDAFCDLIDGKQSAELFTELQPGRTRTALFHNWTEEYHIVEYETTGKAWEAKKFTPTGNVYDLKE